MHLSGVLTATLFGAMSLSGAMANRELTQSKSCEKFPHLPHCQEGTLAEYS